MGENSQHHLDVYLTSLLPKIGLDPETYAPYITGLLPTPEEDIEQRRNIDDKELETELEEELEGIIQLLQASSESHGDDTQTWIDLKSTIKQKDAEYRNELRISRERAEDRRKEEIELNTRAEIELALASEEERKMVEMRESQQKKEMDPAKRALLEQYAYDESELYDNDGKLISPDAVAADVSGSKDSISSKSNGNVTSGPGGNLGSRKVTKKGSVDADTSNRAMAQKYNQEAAQQVRSTQVQTKKEERGKTKNAKLDKMKQKEERRKRAQKGERKR